VYSGPELDGRRVESTEWGVDSLPDFEFIAEAAGNAREDDLDPTQGGTRIVHTALD
jgi:hypothetical protein